MLWHTEMTCGVHLGILLFCLVQAEHVCCLWATQAQSSQGLNSNRYVGFSQQHSGLGSLGGSYPQNQLRQASAQSSSFNTGTAVNSGYNQRLSSSGETQTFSQPAHSGHTSVRLVQSSSVSRPNWREIKLKQVNSQKVPKQLLSLPTSIASGSSVSKYSENQNDLTDISKKRTWPLQQGTLHASNYLSGSSASVQSPSKSKSASQQSAAQNAPSTAAETAAYHGQRGYSPMTSSSLFSAGAPMSKRKLVRMQTSASAPARRVSRKPYQSGQFPVNVGAQGSYKPTYSSSPVSYSQALLGSNKQNAHVNFQPHGPEMPTSQRLRHKSGYASTEQIPRSTRNSALGARNLPASGSGRVGAQRFAPTRIYSIPQRYGGYAIRRLQEPADQKEVSVREPLQTYTAPPQQRVPYKPQVQSAHKEIKWKRFRPLGTQAGVLG